MRKDRFIIIAMMLKFAKRKFGAGKGEKYF
jgi:hypothetical protein